MPKVQYDNSGQGLVRRYEFLYKKTNLRGLPVVPFPILNVTEEGHTLEFTQDNLVTMFSLFLEKLTQDFLVLSNNKENEQG